ncbi:MAG TPA: sterol desaturase family protein [Gammaproteobacteria bacterium]|jgi:sterol desaturase/sphingolipid hydroxylase (fatty acid hydroxylase superfamily)|nr:sterol desaturase family protein [Gammaproteobacteria bacterium]|tara:strand:- start:4138 stop:5214 length:1077 start_codon:yes stop_codon:yes gene_type:complete
MAAEPANSTLSQNPEAIVGPFTDIVQRTTGIIAANTPNDLHWDRLLIMLFLALAIFVIYNGHGAKAADGGERKTGLLQFLLPRDIYTHVSARVDVWLWVLERVLRPFWFVGLFATVGPTTEQTVISSLEFVFGATPAFESAFSWMLLYSLFSLLCYDFMFFSFHYTMHKVPALWAIHKIHHTAEVLTPLTRTREHFLAGPIWATGSAFAFGVAAGLFAYLFNGGITQATLFNVSFFSFLFGLTGAFRHYHIEFRYPRWLSVWIQSPAMHHVHHSYLQKHWDTNMAAVTSIFDRLFGTLYISEKNEHTPWGIGPDTQDQYRSFWQNTIGPFRDWYRMLSRGQSPQAGAVPTPTEEARES